MNRTASRTAGDWRSRDARQNLHPFTDFHDLGRKGARTSTRAEGVCIYVAIGAVLLFRAHRG